MLAHEERFMIRELYRKGVSISVIARRTGVIEKQSSRLPPLLTSSTLSRLRLGEAYLWA